MCGDVGTAFSCAGLQRPSSRLGLSHHLLSHGPRRRCLKDYLFEIGFWGGCSSLDSRIDTTHVLHSASLYFIISRSRSDFQDVQLSRFFYSDVNCRPVSTYQYQLQIVSPLLLWTYIDTRTISSQVQSFVASKGNLLRKISSGGCFTSSKARCAHFIHSQNACN
jgi:hypothetical protein